jgi:3-oxoacyl-ACP reductase-like protein
VVLVLLLPLQVALGKMDPNFQHPLIHIYLLKRRKQALEEGQEQEQKEDEALMPAEADTAARGINEGQQGLEEVAAPATSVAAVADALATSVAAASGVGDATSGGTSSSLGCADVQVLAPKAMLVQALQDVKL